MSDAGHQLTIRPFRASDQQAARALIEQGLGEHFGFIDRAANPDVLDIGGSFANGRGALFVAEVGGELVGTTGVIVAAGRAQLVRVTVAHEHRRRGIASALLARVTDFARAQELSELVVHTQPEWTDAMGFYRRHGFEQVGRDEVDVHLRRPVGATMDCQPPK